MTNYEQKFKELLHNGEDHSLDFGDGCRAFLREFGGWEGLAKEAYLCFTDPSATPNTKANLLKNTLSIFEAYARIHKDAAPGESSMTNDELMEQAGPLLKQLGMNSLPVDQARFPANHENPSPPDSTGTGEPAETAAAAV